MIEQEGVHIVVFDESVCENKNVLSRVRCMFAEERILRIGHFEVCLDEATSGGTLYIKARGVTQIEHLLESSHRCPTTLPIHCFDLVTISGVLDRRVKGFGLVGE